MGNWKNDQKSGKGIFIFSSGNKYEGGFERDVFNGNGKFEFVGNGWYEGGFLDGDFSGYGARYGHDGKCAFKGQWKDDEPVIQK